jgi:hypothetical protein
VAAIASSEWASTLWWTLPILVLTVGAGVVTSVRYVRRWVRRLRVRREFRTVHGPAYRAAGEVRSRYEGRPHTPPTRR